MARDDVPIGRLPVLSAYRIRGTAWSIPTLSFLFSFLWFDMIDLREFDRTYSLSVKYNVSLCAGARGYMVYDIFRFHRRYSIAFLIVSSNWRTSQTMILIFVDSIMYPVRLSFYRSQRFDSSDDLINQRRIFLSNITPLLPPTIRHHNVSIRVSVWRFLSINHRYMDTMDITMDMSMNWEMESHGDGAHFTLRFVLSGRVRVRDTIVSSCHLASRALAQHVRRHRSYSDTRQDSWNHEWS